MAGGARRRSLLRQDGVGEQLFAERGGGEAEPIDAGRPPKQRAQVGWHDVDQRPARRLVQVTVGVVRDLVGPARHIRHLDLVEEQQRVRATRPDVDGARAAQRAEAVGGAPRDAVAVDPQRQLARRAVIAARDVDPSVVVEAGPVQLDATARGVVNRRGQGTAAGEIDVDAVLEREQIDSAQFPTRSSRRNRR